MMRAVLAVFLVLFIGISAFPQEVIKEKVEIKPKLSTGKIQSLNEITPYYIRSGGNVRINFIHAGIGRYKLYEESLGCISNLMTSDGIINLGPYPQWSCFWFYMQDSLGNKLYASPWGPLSFYTYLPDYPDAIFEFLYILSVETDNSLASMPPAYPLETWGNPFVPCQSFKTTVKGRAYAWVKNVNFTADAELWVQTPHSQMVGNSSTINQWDLIDLGDMAAGDSLLLYLRSSNTIVSGLNLYPRYLPNVEYLEDGYVYSSQLDFEDWTDLYFDNLSIQILFQPDPVEYTGPIAVIMTPDKIAPGDTVSLSFKRKFLDGTMWDFFPDDIFEVGIMDGCVGGNLLYNGQEGAYFDGILQPIQFVAADSIEGDSAVVKIRVGVYDRFVPSKITSGNNKAQYSANKETISSVKRNIQLPVADKNKSNNFVDTGTNSKIKPTIQLSEPIKNGITRKENLFKNSPIKTASETCFGGDFYANSTFATRNIVLKNNNYEILLGETKYYQARVGNDGKLQIEEVKPGSDGVPQLNGGISTDIWGDNPISSVNTNEKVGVYWEKEKPIWGTSQTLAKGLIRLIGRYWEDKKTNKVKLTAQSEAENASIEIEVKKPNKLGNTNYIIANDVFNNSYDIDNYCISNAGKSGVPPQLIKAQMLKETSFKPSYRYEPWYDLSLQNDPKFFKQYFGTGNTFVVTKGSMGLGAAVPTTHINLGNVTYPSTPKLIEEIIADNLTARYWNSKKQICTNNGGKDINDLYKLFYDFKNGSKAQDIALNKVKDRLKINGIKRYNKLAQSRIVASYSPFQQTYFNAVDWRLDNFRYKDPNYYPEMLNEPDHQFDAYLSRIKKVLSQAVGTKLKNAVDFEGNNWDLGFEATWYNYEKTYNSGEKKYQDVVLNYFMMFLPK